MSVLVIAEHTGTALKTTTHTTIDAASHLGPVTVLVMGGVAVTPAEEAAKLEHVTEVLLVEAPHLEHMRAEECAEQVVGLADKYRDILFPATTFGKNVMGRVAGILESSAISDVIEIIDNKTFKHPTYAGNAIATVQTTEKKLIATIRPTAFNVVGESGRETKVTVIGAKPSLGLSTFVREELSDSSKPQLGSAKIVVSGGRGLKEAGNFSMLEDLAGKLGGGAIGATRAAVDLGWVPNDYQVGQTGKVVAPDIYFAVGISGAIQHLAGMKDSKVIVAINKDENAPIFDVATYGLVADLFEAIPELIKELS
jgi:electron transfer flavoprotein alpha subunit